eukprot:618956_1
MYWKQNDAVDCCCISLHEQKEELMSLKREYYNVTETLSEVQSQIHGLESEFRLVYKKKNKFERENASLKTELNEELNAKFAKRSCFKTRLWCHRLHIAW